MEPKVQLALPLDGAPLGRSLEHLHFGFVVG
jgi:hypothetical protein